MVNHKFHDVLIPKQEELKYLFIGTFNPEYEERNDAEYFYGRNSFWCILPHAFGAQCLINEGRKKWEEFCNEKKIGLTDLIKSLTNVNKEEIKKDIFSDATFNNYEMKFIDEEIISLIEKNKTTLKGVFFTRKSPAKNINNIWEKWDKILNRCSKLNKTNGGNIYFQTLLSPSLRGSNIRDVVSNWSIAILNSESK